MTADTGNPTVMPDAARPERVLVADLDNPDHGAAVLSLLRAYALDIMGGGGDLSPYAKANLIPSLRARADALAIIAFVGDEPAGLAVCIEGFSTFACKPLLNIHDMVVAAPFRGRGLSHRILAKAEEVARARGCCKLTLEVLEGNTVARQAYASFGFAGYALDPAMGTALFLQKKLE